MTTPTKEEVAERKAADKAEADKRKAAEGIPKTKNSEGGKPVNVGSETARLAAALRKGDPDGDVLAAAAERLEALDTAAAFHNARADRAEKQLEAKNKALAELEAK
jgi:hypothetical protein